MWIRKLLCSNTIWPFSSDLIKRSIQPPIGVQNIKAQHDFSAKILKFKFWNSVSRCQADSAWWTSGLSNARGPGAEGFPCVRSISCMGQTIAIADAFWYGEEVLEASKSDVQARCSLSNRRMPCRIRCDLWFPYFAILFFEDPTICSSRSCHHQLARPASYHDLKLWSLTAAV